MADFATPLAATTMLAYDAMNNVTASTDAGGFLTSLAYDQLYRQTTLTDPGGGITTTAYDKGNDVLSVTDANGQTTSFGYDALQRKTTVTNPLLAGQTHPGVTTMAYDADDNMVSLKDPDGNTTTFQFDALNRQTKLTDPLNANATFAYDAGDRLTAQTDRDGRVKLYTYDGLDRELTETWKSGASTVNVLTFAYDPGDNITAAADYHGSYTMGYDTLARLTSEQEPFNLTLTFAYDANDNRTRVQDSFGGVLTSVYDGLDRLTSRQFGGTGQTPLRFDLGYNSRNDLATVNRYSDLAGTVTVGYSSYSYDAVNRETSIQHQNGSGSVLANYAYGYDPGSRLTHETADGSTRTFQYDSNNELTNDGVNTYSYDLNGNRTMTGYTTGTGNELTGDGTWTYAYDGEGNTISKRNTTTGELWTFGYDLDNRMVTAKDVSGAGATLTLATYTYDVFGNRLEKDVWTQASGTTTVTRFGYDGDQVWADLAGDNSSQMRYLRGDETDQLFARIGATGLASWYLTDWEGSVRKLTDGSGNLTDTITYDGFGNVTAETNATAGGTYKFDGMRLDAETQEYSTWGRTETPQVGRWVQQDPSGFAGDDPNLYRTDGNDATNLTDPSGLRVIIVGFEGAGGYQPDRTKAAGMFSGALLRTLYLDPVEKKWGRRVDVMYEPQDTNISSVLATVIAKAEQPSLDPEHIGRSILAPCYDRLVIAGYSWGGAAAIKLVDLLTHNAHLNITRNGLFPRFEHIRDPIRTDLLFTIDPVTKYIPNRTFSTQKKDLLVNTWINYYQESDTKDIG